MAIGNTALINLIVIVVIGIICGVGFSRYGSGWFARNVTGARQTDVTTALVGIAGAFIGFHIGVVLRLLPLPLMQYLLAVVGALVVLALWRGR